MKRTLLTDFLTKRSKILASWLVLLLVTCIATTSRAQLYYVVNDGGSDNAATTNDAFVRANYDGTGLVKFAAGAVKSPGLTALDIPHGRAFVYDSYSTAPPAGLSLKTIELSTGNVLANIPIQVPARVVSIKYDPINDYVYAILQDGGLTTATASDQLIRWKPTGSSYTVLASSFCSNPSMMTLDIQRGKVYILNNLAANRGIVTYDIASQQMSGVQVITGLVGKVVGGVEMEYDSATGYLYLLGNDGASNATVTYGDGIFKFLPDGTDLSVIATGIGSLPYSAAFDLGNDKAYFFDNNTAYKYLRMVDMKTGAVTTVADYKNTSVFAVTSIEPARRAFVNATTATNISSLSVTLAGGIPYSSADVTERGVVYSISNAKPTITSDTKVAMGTGIGAFSQSVTGLSPVTNYYVRAYAISAAGISYGDVSNFTTTSNNANLAALTLSQGTLSPVFADATTSYTADVTYDVTAVKIKPTLQQANAVIKVNGATVLSDASSGDISLATGANTISVVVTAQDGITKKTYTIVVTRAKTPQTITFPAFTAKTYGGTDFDPGASVASTLPITYTSSNTSVATIVSGKIHIVGAGNSTITASQAGNTIYLAATNTTQVLTVDKAVLTYNSAAASRNYGAANPIFTGNVSGFLGSDTQAGATTGTLVFSSTATSAASVGTQYPINGSGLSAANYTFAQAAGNANALTIGKTTVIYTVQPASKVYGDDNPLFNVNYTGLANGQVISDVATGVTTTTTATKLSGIGSYAVTVNGLSASNYDFTAAASNTTALSITKATLSYVSNAVSRRYGEVNPTLSGKITGFLNGDTESTSTSGTLSFATSASATSGIGTYAITGSGKTATNYAFAQAPANSTAFTVTKNALTYVATPVSRAYNTSSASPITGTITGFLNGDTQATATTGTLTFSTAVTIASGVGSYAINGSGLSSANYDIVQSTANASAYSIYLASNGNLSSLTISQGALSPSFSSGTNTYTASVSNAVTELTVTSTLSDANANVTVNGTQVTSGSASSTIALAVGDNTIHVNVTAQDGTTTNPYTVTVKRAPSPDATFSAFTVAGAGVSVSPDPNFTVSYIGTVAKDVTSFTVTASVTAPTTTLYVNGVITPSGSTVTLPLAKGYNSYAIVAQAQDGVTYQYRYVNITRAFSDIKTLVSLGVSSGTLSPAFASGINSYTLAVSNDTKSVEFTPTLTDAALSSVLQDGLPALPSFTRTLAIGDNSFLLTVRAEDGTTNEYTVNVQRAVSHDASLSSLGLITATGAIEPFDANTFAYNTTVTYDVDALRLNPVAANDGATIKINGVPVNSSGGAYYFNYFTVAETIQVEVTAGDGTTVKTYTITATRGMSDNTLLANLEVLDGSLNNYAISPEFNAATNTYNLSISDPAVGFVYVRPTKGESHQEIRVNFGGALNGGSSQYVALNSGSNTVGIRVLAQDGTVSNYTLNVTRGFSSNANISTITLSQGITGGFSQFFNSFPGDSVFTSVPNNIDYILIGPGPADAGASATVNGYSVPKDSYSASMPLALGDNLVTIGITSADNTTTKYYKLHITRLPFVDVALSSLTGDKGFFNFPFSADRTSYNVTVGSADEYFTLTPVAHAADVTVQVNNVNITASSPSYTNTNPLTAFGTTTFRTVVRAADGITTKTYTVRVSRQANSIASLGGITLSSGTIAPAFSSTITSYNASVDNAIASLHFTPQSPEAAAVITVSFRGNTTTVNSGTPYAVIPLSVGDNLVTTTVKSLDGNNIQTYMVTINRNAAATDATLVSLSLSDGTLSPVFSSATENYTASVNNAFSTITVIPATTDSHATVKVGGTTVASGSVISVPLSVGNNTIATTVTAQDSSTTKTYTLTLNRATANNDTTLANLEISDGTLSPAFSASTNTYTASVGNGVDSLHVRASTNDSHATLTVNGVTPDALSGDVALPLATGYNTLAILVTAQDGSTKTYTLTVNRAKSSVATMASLSVGTETLNPVFNPATLTYNVGLPNGTTSISFTPTLTDTGATLTVNAAPATSGVTVTKDNLAVGMHNYYFVVTSEDGSTTQTYTLNVYRAYSGQAEFSNILLSAGTLSPAYDRTADPNYSVVAPVGVESIDVTPVLLDTTAVLQARLNGRNLAPTNGKVFTVPLTALYNTLTITSTAQDGTTLAIYTVALTRTVSSDTTLSGLTASIGVFKQPFSSSLTSYQILVPADATNIILSPTATSNFAAVAVDGKTVAKGMSSQSLLLTAANNSFRVEVTAEDGTRKTINVFVTKASTNANLYNLTLSAGTLSPAFNKDTYEYTARVQNTTTSITLTPTAADTLSTIKVNGFASTGGIASAPVSLATGTNAIPVEVSTAYGETKTYVINVTRAGSRTISLSSLSITPGNLTRIGSTDEWTASFSGGTGSFQLKAATTISACTIKINGVNTAQNTASAPIIFTDPSTVVPIEITAEDGITKRTLTIRITRAASRTISLSSLSVSPGNLTRIGNTDEWTASFSGSTGSVQLKAATTIAACTIKINGVATAQKTASAPITLTGPSTVLPIEITAEDGVTKRTLTIRITRAASRTISLSSLSITPGNLTRLGSTDEWTASFSGITGSVQLKAATTIAACTIKINGVTTAQNTASAPVTLTGPSTVIPIVITAEDGITKRTLTITINRPSPPVIAAAPVSRQTPIGVIQRNDANLQVPDDLIVKQGLSPNGDGVNDRFTIEGIDMFPDNTVRVMNRNGDVIYEAKGYDNLGQSFDGHSSKGTLQQPGTYFYSIEYKKGAETKRKTGFIVIKY